MFNFLNIIRSYVNLMKHNSASTLAFTLILHSLGTFGGRYRSFDRHTWIQTESEAKTFRIEWYA